MAGAVFRSSDDRRAGSQCRHDGFYSGAGLYAHESQLLRYVLICDDCGEEMKELFSHEYVPSPDFAAVLS
jgi:hypothetical protein